MAADTGTVSFGIKTSQAGMTYEQVLQAWAEAEDVPEIEHAWLWDHLVPLRGEVTGRRWRHGRCWPGSPPRPAACGWA